VSSYPGYFEDCLEQTDSVQFACFTDENQQAECLAQRILENIKTDELDMDDILVILPDTLRAKQQAKLLMDTFAKFDIPTHMAGVTASQDMIFDKNSIAISNIHRAKGSEAPMVYVLDCQYCFAGREQIRKRNVLFTAITRSKAWVRLYGYGEFMKELCDEIQRIINNNYELEFVIPTPEQLRAMRRIHRELTASEKKKIKKAESGLKKFLEALESGLVDYETLSTKQKKALEKFLGQSYEESENS
jgi:superfamily I DNA and RNA helicase